VLSRFRNFEPWKLSTKMNFSIEKKFRGWRYFLRKNTRNQFKKKKRDVYYNSSNYRWPSTRSIDNVFIQISIRIILVIAWTFCKNIKTLRLKLFDYDLLEFSSLWASSRRLLPYGLKFKVRTFSTQILKHKAIVIEYNELENTHKFNLPMQK